MVQTNINNWLFSQDDKGNLSVTPPDELRRKKPDLLYKYYGLSENSLDVIEQLRIYASNPYVLNDPFDAHDSIIQFDNIDAIRQIFKGVEIDPFIKSILNTSPEELKELASYLFRLVVYSRLGIYCLTESPDNLLMWSYYSNHKGFAIEFDYNAFPFKFHGPFQMNYRDTFTPISIAKGGWICALYQSTLKAKDWTHENEWRMLPEREGQFGMGIPQLNVLKNVENATERYFEITPQCIKKVILGNRFFNPDNEFLFKGDHVEIAFQENVELKNRLLNGIDRNNLPVEIIYRNINGFGLKSTPILLKRIDDKRIKLTKNVA